jgi:hypothetical protein
MRKKDKISNKDRLLLRLRKIILSRDMFFFALFLFLASIFWFVQSLDRKREVALKIPVEYIGIPEDIEMEKKLPTQFSVKVRDDGSSLLRYKKKEINPLALDLKRTYYGKGRFVISADQLKNRLTSYMFPSTAILSIDPDSIVVNYYRLSSKTLPIKVHSKISFASQYFLSDDFLVEPATVKVFGPKSLLDTLSAVYTEKIELKNLSDTVVVKAKFDQSISNLKYAFEDVTITAFVEMFTEGKKQLPITIINCNNHENVRVFPPEVQVAYNVGLSKFSKIKDNDIKIVFDCDESRDLKRRRYKLNVINNSDYISNIRVSPEEVEFLFENK